MNFLSHFSLVPDDFVFMFYKYLYSFTPYEIISQLHLHNRGLTIFFIRPLFNAQNLRFKKVIFAKSNVNCSVNYKKERKIWYRLYLYDAVLNHIHLVLNVIASVCRPFCILAHGFRGGPRCRSRGGPFLSRHDASGSVGAAPESTRLFPFCWRYLRFIEVLKHINAYLSQHSK